MSEPCDPSILYLGIAEETQYMKRKSRSVILSEGIARRLHADTRPLNPGSPDGWQDLFFPDGSFQDEWGVTWSKPEGGHYNPTGNPLREATLADLDRFPWPDPFDPGRVRGLIFEGGHLFNRKQHDAKLSMLALLHDPQNLPKTTRLEMAKYHGEDWPQIIRNWAGAWIDLDHRDGDLYHGRLNEIKCPVLVIHGGRDEYSKPSEIEELTRLIPDAQLSLYPEAGHSVHDDQERRETCTQAVRAFLSAIPGSD